MLSGRWAWVPPPGPITCSPRRASTRNARLGAAGQGGRAGACGASRPQPCRFSRSLAVDQQCDRHRCPRPRDFRAVLRGCRPRPPRRALIPYLSGDSVILASGCPSPLSAGHELFFHFYTGTNRNDKTRGDEGRTEIDKPWKTLSTNNRRTQHTESRQEGGWGPGESPGRPFAGTWRPCYVRPPRPRPALGGARQWTWSSCPRGPWAAEPVGQMAWPPPHTAERSC